MKERKKINRGTGAGRFISIVCIMFITLFGAFVFNSCEKSTTYNKPADNPLASKDVTPPAVSTVSPVIDAVSVPTSTTATVTFNEKMNIPSFSTSTFTLKQGTNLIPGTVTGSSTVAVFTPSAALLKNTVYTGTISTGVRDSTGNALAADFIWSFTTAADLDTQKPTVISVVPANSATAIPTNTKVTLTFSEAMDAATISASTVTLKKGSTAVPGTLTYSGQVATFTPSSALAANSLYTGTVSTGAKDVAGNALAANYTWSFTTAAAADVTPPTIQSVLPAANATSVATGAKATVTFNETMDAASINATTFTLKQGSAAIAGTVTFSGTTATFTPSAPLSGSTLYTAAISTGAKDASGNALAAIYTWSFTTGVLVDVTPPTVTSVTPLNNSTSIALTVKPAAVFNEAMNSGTITSSTFTMKQGTSAVNGTVSYSGTTATFTPSADLTAGTVYTCTITTGAKDAAGNAIASNYTWSFTTLAAATGKSFSADVVPILTLCNTCHTHSWTTSSNTSTFYTNLVTSGHVKPTAVTTSKIYTKLSGGHPGSIVTTAQVNTILTWFNEGALNN
jgi:hypothetical protein